MKKGIICKRLLTLILTFAMIIEGAGFMRYPVSAGEIGDGELLAVEEVSALDTAEPGNDASAKDVTVTEETAPNDDKEPAEEALQEFGNAPENAADESSQMNNDGETSGDFTYSVSDEKATITKYSGTDTSVTIPASIGGYPVVEIQNTFNNNGTIESVSIPNSVTRVGNYAFSGCEKLSSVTLPSGLKELGYRAFYNCKSLTSISLPSGLEKIDSYVFYDCPIENITIPAGIKEASSNSYNLVKSVSFANGIEEIPNYVLQGAQNLESVTIPGTVTKIGSYAFAGCGKLSSLTLPASLKEIGYEAFYNCESLASISLPSGLEKIEGYAFYGCPIDSISIPASTTSMGSYAFNKVKSVTFGSGIEEIPNSVLQGAQDLTSVTIPETVTKIGSYAFAGCSKLSSVILPATLKEIGYEAFYNCESLTAITLPSGLEKIGSYAFNNCPIETVTIPASITEMSYSSFNKTKSVVFEAGIEEIPDYALEYAQGLESVTIPSSVKKIGTYAFYGCKALKEVAIPAGAEVEYYAFYQCEGLETLTIGNDAVLGRYAFKDCKGIKKLVIGDNVTIDPTSFDGVTISGSVENTNITYELSIADGMLAIKGTGNIPDFTEEAPAPWTKLGKVSSVSIEEGITGVGQYAFAGMTSITSLSLSESVTYIGKSAFSGCVGLSYVEFPKGIKTIDENAFAGCTGINEMVFCGDAPSINAKAFAGAIKSGANAYYPQTATGWSRSRFQNLSTLIEWETWDNTQATKDIVLVLDHSGSMGGKMERLHDAAASFINGVGGRRQNARIAVVKYDDTAEVLSDFTSDCTALISKIKTLTDDGGTEYLRALNTAEEVIKTSTADKKSMIMFSDGQPNDNQTAIYEKAAELQKKYTMYSVGLMSSYNSSYDDTYREILIKVAGSEKRYFEADNIDALLQAFLNLQKDLGRQEQTSVDVLRHNVHHDLLNDYVEFTVGSNEEIVLTILPGLNLGDFDRVALVQNDKEIISSDNGQFRIMPGQLFAADSAIYAVTYDANGNILEKRRIGLNILQEYKITYYMNDNAGTVYTVDTLIGGQEIIPPADPERDGYKFMGWFTTQDAAGFDFFSWYNSYNRKKVEADLNLYAHWVEQSSTLNPAKDIWKFGNYTSVFGRGDYEISSGDFLRLLESTDSETTKQALKADKADVWGGSCFGMSSTVVLNRQGQINITEFDPSSLYVRQADLYKNSQGDLDVGNIESMINFYQLRQKVGGVYSALGNFSRNNESYNIGEIVKKLRDSASPCVLILNLYDGNTIKGGHAVVAYDFEDMADGSSEFKVYDCSFGPDNVYPIKVTRSGSIYSADLGTWPADWGRGLGLAGPARIFLRNALNDNDLVSEAYLTRPSFSFQPDRGVDDFVAYIESSYGGYTISDGTDSAVIKDGLKTSGTLDIIGYGNTNEVDAEPCYKAELVMKEGKTYTITPDTGAAKYDTEIFSYEDNGFFANTSAASPLTINFDMKGKIEASGSTDADQVVGTGINGMTTPWYHVDVTASSTGINMTPAKDKVEISSAASTTADIVISSDFNEFKFENITITPAGVTVKEENGKTVVISNGQTAASIDYGYSVVFDSRLGTSVESLTGVKSGTKLEEPVDPSRPGFLFTGWYKDADCRTLWNFDTDTVTKDTILYAGWSLDENYFLIVNFRIKGDDSQLLYIQKGTKLDINSCPTDENGNNLSWYSDEECTVPWNFDTVLEKNTELYSPDWNAKRKTVGDVPSDEIPESGVPEGIWIGGMTSPEYTGKAVIPSFHVYDNSRLLTEKIDYTVAFKNNTNAFTLPEPLTDEAKKKAPSVTITMKGNYSGKETAYFSILQKNINTTEFTVDELTAQYNGSSQKPKTVKLYRNGKALSPNKDYTIDFGSGDYVGEANNDKTYTITLTGIGNYSGVREVEFIVYGKNNANGKEQISINDKKIAVAKIPDQKYTGSTFTVSALKDKNGNAIPLLKYNGTDLVEGVDYKATFKDAKNPGIATIVIAGLGGKAEGAAVSIVGTRKVTFKINGVSIKNAAVKGIEKSGYEYTGQAIKPSVYLEGIDKNDYSVQFENNVNAGTATVIFTGKNGYTDTKKATFSIKKAVITDSNTKVNNGVIVSVPYEKGGAAPAVTVTRGGRTLKLGRDYKIKFRNNTKPATYNASRNKGPEMIISGMGNYSGSTTVKFTITTATMNKRIIVTAQDVVYNPGKGKYVAKFTVTDVNGKVLKAGTDYDKTIYYKKVTTSSSGYESTSSLGKKDVPEAGTRIRMTIYGRSPFYSGEASADYYIISPQKDLAKAKIVVKNQAYTGKSVTLTSADQFSTLTDAAGNPLKFGSEDPANDDFEVVSYKNNISKGKATVVLKGKGNGVDGYGGTKTVTFNIGVRTLADIWFGWFRK